MNYKDLMYLKYVRGVPTNALMHRYPYAIEKVSEVALLDLPLSTLKQLHVRNRRFSHLLQLKRKFLTHRRFLALRLFLTYLMSEKGE